MKKLFKIILGEFVQVTPDANEEKLANIFQKHLQNLGLPEETIDELFELGLVRDSLQYA